MKGSGGGLESASLIAGDVALDSSENTNGVPDSNVLNTVAVSFWKIYWVGFLVQLEGNIILPTIWDYVKNHFQASVIVYGGILSVQAAAETIGALILGFWSDRRPMRYPLMAMTSLFILSNIIYICAWNTNVWIIMLARFIAGLGFGGQSVTLAYITHNSSAQQRNHKIAMFWFTCLSTNIFGPLLTFLLIKADIGASSNIINQVTIPSLFNIAFYAINTIVIYFHWPSTVSHHVSEKQAKMHYEDRGFRGMLNLLRTIPLLGFVFLYIKLVFSLMVSVLQAIASPITDQETSNNSLIFLVIGTVIIGGVLLTKLINRCVSDYNTLQIGQVTAFISLFGLLHWGIKEKDNRDALFGLASIILTIGNSIGITISTAAYSKAIGQFHPRKGTLMGWFITAAAIARIIGPILSCIGLETVGLNVIGGVLIFMSLVAIVVLSFSRLRMHYLQSADTIR